MTAPSDPPNGTCSACGTVHTGDACPAAGALHIGSVLEGKYELTRLVGSGGMGEVYEGRHRIIGRRVAVKFLHSEHARRPEVASRFANEARAAGGIEHENIAGVYDVGALADGTQYLVMEFLDGADLEKIAEAEGGSLPAARVAAAIVQACRGLEVVHARGIVHRDLKPSNLFVTKRGDKSDLIKVIDFGIAKLTDLAGAAGTKTGTAMGTAYYMSPEQARGERDVGPATDIHALGIILYELLSGQRPYEGETFLQILHKVLLQQAIPLSVLRPGLPNELCAVVARAMAPNAADRFPSAAALGEALLPFAVGALSSVPPLRSEPLRAANAPPAVETAVQRTFAQSNPGHALAMTPMTSAAQRPLTSAPGDSAIPRARRPLLIVGAIVGVGLLGAAAMAMKLSASPPREPAGVSLVAGAASVLEPAQKQEPVVRLVEADERPSAAPPATATAPSVGAPAVSAVSGHRTVGETERRVGAGPVVTNPRASRDAGAGAAVASTVQTPSAKPAPNCEPNFTYDSDGNKQFKPECFLQHAP